jgi:hypothetical protein
MVCHNSNVPCFFSSENCIVTAGIKNIKIQGAKVKMEFSQQNPYLKYYTSFENPKEQSVDN